MMTSTMNRTVEQFKAFDRAVSYVSAISTEGFLPIGVPRPSHGETLGRNSVHIDKTITYYEGYVKRAEDFMKDEAARAIKLIEGGDDGALEDYLDGANRWGIRTDCNPTIHGELAVYMNDEMASKVMRDYSQYLTLVDRLHRLQSRLFMWEAGIPVTSL